MDENEIFIIIKGLLIKEYGVPSKFIRPNAKFSLDLCLDEFIYEFIYDVERIFNVNLTGFDKSNYYFESSINILPLRSFFSRYKKYMQEDNDKPELLINDVIKSIKANKWVYDTDNGDVSD